MELDKRFEARAHPKLVQLAKLWRDMAGSSRMPGRDVVRTAEIRRWSPGHLYVVDVLDGGADYFFRLFGEYFKALAGFDLTQRRLSEIEQSSLRLESLRTQYDEIVRFGLALYQPGRLVWPNGEKVYHERLHMPFGGSDGQVSLILGATECETRLEDFVLYRGLGAPTLVLDDPIPLIYEEKMVALELPR